jgi:uncharacterized protein (DUF427 family)
MNERVLQPSAHVLRHRNSWRLRGQQRPAFAREPQDGEESVWDYPRPPRIEPESRLVSVRAGSQRLAESRRAVRVLETASPPTFYLPPEDVDTALLTASGLTGHCEWKGESIDLDLLSGASSVAWRYDRVYPEFASIRSWVAFYPGRVVCFVGKERVRPQPGGYYGGWITDEIVGPVKGEPGIDG